MEFFGTIFWKKRKNFWKKIRLRYYCKLFKYALYKKEKKNYTYTVLPFLPSPFSGPALCLHFPARHRSIVPSLSLCRPDEPVNRGWCRTNHFVCSSKPAPQNRIRRWSFRCCNWRRIGNHPLLRGSGVSALDRWGRRVCTRHLSLYFRFLK